MESIKEVEKQGHFEDPARYMSLLDNAIRTGKKEEGTAMVLLLLEMIESLLGNSTFLLCDVGNF